MSIDALTKKIPPPAEPVHTGDESQWHSVLDQLGRELPRELFELSRQYGSGSFVEGDFWLSVHSVFRPRFDLLTQYNDKVFRSLAAQEPDPYSHMFELGAYGFGDEQGNMRRLFWDTRGEPDEWIIRCSTSPERFKLPLTDFLFRLFSNDFEIDGFPSHFESVLFEVAEWEEKLT